MAWSRSRQHERRGLAATVGDSSWFWFGSAQLATDRRSTLVTMAHAHPDSTEFAGLLHHHGIHNTSGPGGTEVWSVRPSDCRDGFKCGPCGPWAERVGVATGPTTSLAVYCEALPHTHSRQAHTTRSNRNGAAPRRKVVLVLEDHASVGGLIAGLVRQEGYRAVRAWDVHEAMRLAKDRTVDAVVLDLNLAYPDGLDALQQLATQGVLRQAPVVLVAGGAVQPSQSEQALIREVVRKPFDIDVMLNAVRGAVGDPVIPIAARQFDEQDYFLNGF